MTFTPEEIEDAPRTTLEELGIKGPALVVRSGGGRAGETFVAREAQTTIGRSPDCDIFLDDVTVSRKHAVIVATRRRASSIEDLGSLNGTFLNRKRIESAQLEDGDELQIGKYRLTFLEPLMATATRSALAHDRGGLRDAEGRVPGHLDLEDPLPRGPGLLAPQRTRGGYRLFSEEDVERLETILRLQRDEFLPLRVIRQELASPDARDRRSAAGRPRRPRSRARPRRALRARRDRRAARARARGVRPAGAAHGVRAEALPRAATRTSRSPAGGSPSSASRRGTCAVPHGGRPRGRAARAARRPGAPRPQPGAPPGRDGGPPVARRARPGALAAPLLARAAPASRQHDRVNLAEKIREVPDWPQPGVGFKDVMPLLADPRRCE